MQLDAIPEHLLVPGGGYIGLDDRASIGVWLTRPLPGV